MGADLRSDDEVAALVEEVEADLGPIGVLLTSPRSSWTTGQ